MCPSTNSSRTPFPVDVESLLEEGAWIRRLACGLVGDEQLAEDVTQDVFAEALARAPQLGGAQLRSWLATLTRRFAHRTRDRERDRLHVEREFAKPEAMDASSRLDLHRRLAIAIDQVAEPYRTALILRYFDELQPQEIAARLEITVTAARKRVSRGLTLLREVLDHEFEGGREQWLAAFAPLVIPVTVGLVPDSFAPTFGTGSPASLLAARHGSSLFSAMLTKTNLVTLAVLLSLLGLALYHKPWEPKPLNFGLDLNRGHRVLSPTDEDLASTTAEYATELAALNAQDGGRQAIETTGNTQPQIRVVDSQGNVPPGVAVGWIDRNHFPHVLELDSEGMVHRPEGSGNARFFAYAEDIGSAALVAGPQDEDLVIQLDPGRTIRGRVIEDGGEPVRPVYLTTWYRSAGPRVLTEEEQAFSTLVEAGVTPMRRLLWTEPDGTFLLRAVPKEGVTSILIPGTHLLLKPEEQSVSMNPSSFLIPPGVEEIEIRTIARPSVYGRVLYEEDHSPVGGDLWVRYNEADQDSGWSLQYWTIESDGTFAFPLPISGDFATMTPEQREAAVAVSTIRVGLHSAINRGPDRSPLTLEQHSANGLVYGVQVQGVSYPIELGTLFVPAPEEVWIRVVDSSGGPILGATVASNRGSGVTNEEGLTLIPAGPSDQVQVLALGFNLSAIDLPSKLPSKVAAHTIVIEDGVKFTMDLGRDHIASVVPELNWSETPFQGVSRGVKGAPDRSPGRIHAAFNPDGLASSSFRSSASGRGNYSMSAPASGLLHVPGLRPGAEFNARLADILGQVLVQKHVTLPQAGESLVVPLKLKPELHTMLSLRVVDPEGEIVPDARVFMDSADGMRGVGFDCDFEWRRFGPLARGQNKMRFSAPGFVPQVLEAYSMSEVEQELEVVLLPARNLRVRIVSESGEEVKPDSLRVFSDSGWEAPAPFRPGNRGPANTFRNVPVTALVAEAKFGTEVYHADALPGDLEVTIVLPELESVEIDWSHFPVLAGAWGALHLSVTNSGSKGQMDLTSYYSSGPDSAPRAVNCSLLPCAYGLLVTLEDWPDDSTNDGSTKRVVYEGQFVIEAGQENRLTFNLGE